MLQIQSKGRKKKKKKDSLIPSPIMYRKRTAHANKLTGAFCICYCETFKNCSFFGVISFIILPKWILTEKLKQQSIVNNWPVICGNESSNQEWVSKHLMAETSDRQIWVTAFPLPRRQCLLAFFRNRTWLIWIRNVFFSPLVDEQPEKKKEFLANLLSQLCKHPH